MEEDDDQNFSEWQEDENIEIKDLFSDQIFTSLEDAVDAAVQLYGFDLRKVVLDLNSPDEFGLIMLVNFIRRRVKAMINNVVDSSFIEALIKELEAKTFMQDHSLLVPEFENDNLLFAIHELAADNEDEDDDIGSLHHFDHQATEIELQRTVEKYKDIVKALSEIDADKADDAYYFNSYSHISIHETMLRDEPRTLAYANAFRSGFFHGKVVLDVGCGSGILCLLAAKAGAKKVVGIDLSLILDRSRKIVERNGFSDVITLVKGRVEDTDLTLELGKVDVIVSEWMGYGLYYENMLSSVINARDKYLRPGGLVMPSSASLYVEGLTANANNDRVTWWEDVYGFDMRDMSDLIFRDAEVQLVHDDDIITDRALAHRLDVASAVDEDLDFNVSFTLRAKMLAEPKVLKAFVISFDTDFCGSSEYGIDIKLSTAPAAAATHWKQVVLWLKPEFRCLLSSSNGGADLINVSLKYQRDEFNARDYCITVNWKVNSTDCSQTFLLTS